MPRGKYVNHKGRSRHFTSPEELANTKDESSEEETESDEESDNAAAGTSKAARAKPKPRAKKTSGGGSSSEEDSDEESSEEDDRDARKGVASLIEIENPNRATKKAVQKLSTLKLEESATKPTKPELTRREREQIEKQKARARYEKLHAAGKTTEAKADLARLALVRQQRAEAAAKREAEKKALDGKKSAGSKA